MKNIKVCPIVTRTKGETKELLLFTHPLAGVQLVKGTLEVSDCSFESAAVRELLEESGINNVSSTHYMKAWESAFQDQVWHFVECVCSDLSDNWTFYTLDDGGHYFDFFWHSLDKEIDFECHEVFQRAIQQIKLMY